MNITSLFHYKSLLAFRKTDSCERLLQAGKSLCVALTLFLFNLFMLLSGAIEDAFQFEAMLTDGSALEPAFVSLAQFLSYPIISSQLLIGLCWLLFYIIPARRAGIYLRKAAFAFCQAKVLQPVPAAHGCRAPPSFTGCL